MQKMLDHEMLMRCAAWNRFKKINPMVPISLAWHDIRGSEGRGVGKNNKDCVMFLGRDNAYYKIL